ncbi:MAG: hypothetical protein ABW121_14880 [Candidatus Thiodiazotropha sp. 6PLUC7]
MYKKKLLTLMVASLLPFSAILNAEEATTEAAGLETEVAEEVVEANVSESDTASSEMMEPAPAEESTEADSSEAAVPQVAESSEAEPVEPAAVDEAASDQAAEAEVTAKHDPEEIMAQRWKEREQRYQALRQRAEEAGVMLPAQPPWRSSQRDSVRPCMDERMEHHQKMMNMSSEERDAFRQQRYQEMREKAQQQGLEMPETPPWVARRQAMEDEWAKHQKVIEGMSEEERAACHAMHRRHMGRGAGHGMGQGHGMGHPGMGCGGPGNCQGPYGNPGGAPAPGYGYGPGAAPYGQGSFWDPSY